MSRQRLSAVAYLRSAPESPWRWAENGSVIVWRDGRTVAFREEVTQVLQCLSPNGLPAFGSVVLLLAACHGYVPTPRQILTESSNELPTWLGPKAAILIAARHQLTVQIEAALQELRRVSEFGPEVRSRVRGKCVLAEAVFEESRAERIAAEFSIEESLRTEFSDSELNPESEYSDSNPLIRHLHWVAAGLRRHTAESLVIRLQTNLESMPDAAPLDALPAQRARHLLDELLKDPEHRIVARAARELMAAVRLPRKLTERDELALGGLADLANRGPLDRLLLSELAYDDLTLTTRIALNEALYLRHEPPAHEPPTSLAILIDAGIRLWGLPRVFATSTALALIASEVKATAVKVWRAHGRNLIPVDLLDRAELLNHLGALETESHPGAALSSFGSALPPGEQAQSVLITHADVLADPDFRRELTSARYRPGFIAAVDREGRFALHAFPFSTRQALCESQLDIEELFSNRKPSVALQRSGTDPHLPVFLRQEPCPFLLPFAGRVDYWTREASGHCLAVLSDRRLIEFTDLRRGGRLIMPKLPPGRTLWLERFESNIHLVKAGSHQRPCRLVSLKDGESADIIDLCSGDTATAAFRSGDALLVVRERDVFAYSLTDGRLLDRALSPHRWHRGRFFCNVQQFSYVSWDGQRVRFAPLPLPAHLGVSKIVTIFDREGHEGPWALNQLCQASSLSGPERVQVPLPLGQSSHRRNIHLSRDGHRIYVTIPDLNWHNIYELETGRADVMRAPLTDLAALDPAPPLPSWNVFRSFDAVHASHPEGFLLRTRKGAWKSLQLEANHRLHLVEAHAPDSAPNEFHKESSSNLQTTHGCSLDVARWPSGSRVFLDSRGLLHLKSHVDELPEISLVLADGEMAAWCSNHVACGPAFFIGDGVRSEPDHVWDYLNEFLRRL